MKIRAGPAYPLESVHHIMIKHYNKKHVRADHLRKFYYGYGWNNSKNIGETMKNGYQKHGVPYSTLVLITRNPAG